MGVYLQSLLVFGGNIFDDYMTNKQLFYDWYFKKFQYLICLLQWKRKHHKFFQNPMQLFFLFLVFHFQHFSIFPFII